MFFIFIGTSDKNLGKFISAKKNPILDPPPGTEVKSGTVNMCPPPPFLKKLNSQIGASTKFFGKKLHAILFSPIFGCVWTGSTLL